MVHDLLTRGKIYLNSESLSFDKSYSNRTSVSLWEGVCVLDKCRIKVEKNYCCQTFPLSLYKYFLCVQYILV